MAKADYSTIKANNGKTLYILDKPFNNETGHPLAFPFEFEPTLHRYRYNSIDCLKTGENIFVCSMADLFGVWIPDEWIQEVFKAADKYKQHNFLFLTKNPIRYMNFDLPDNKNFWYGSTVTDENLSLFADSRFHTFISVEPITEKAAFTVETFQKDSKPDWVIIGAETGNRKEKTIPQLDWVRRITISCKRLGIPVFMKDSMIPIMTEVGMQRDFPKELQNHQISEKMENILHDDCLICKAHLKKDKMLTVFMKKYHGNYPIRVGSICMNCVKEIEKRYKIKIPYSEEDQGGSSE